MIELRDLIDFIKGRKIFVPNDRVLLAVSGGIDSTVMVHLFHEAKFKFAIAHCNFGLRGNESHEDELFVKTLALQLKVSFFSEKFDTEAIASDRGISIQMAARELRYYWFEKVRVEHNFDYIATGHHLDDQVETFLINLIRGTGIAGLHGIPVKNDFVIRPMMFTYRNDVEQFAKKHRITYRTDHSNNETKYLRNKVRHEIIPLLCGINPEFTHGLTESISRIGDFEQIGKQTLDEWCKKAMSAQGREKVINVSFLLNTVPLEPYLWELLYPYGFNETQVSNIIGCLRKETGKVFCSSKYRLVKERDQLVMSLIEPEMHEKPVKIGSFMHKKRMSKPLPLSLERISDVDNYEIPLTGNIASLDFGKLHFPLILRKWQPGDTFSPLGMKKKKTKLSDFFINQKFSLRDKEQTWLLCSGNDIVWIIGHRIDHRYRVTAATKEVLCIVTRDM